MHTMNAPMGRNVDVAIAMAIKEAQKRDCLVQTTFNQHTFQVYGDSNPELIERDFRRVEHSAIKGPAGPYPKPQLDAVDLAADHRNQQQAAELMAHEAIATIRAHTPENKIEDAKRAFFVLWVRVKNCIVTLQQLRVSEEEYAQWQRLYA